MFNPYNTMMILDAPEEKTCYKNSIFSCSPKVFYPVEDKLSVLSYGILNFVVCKCVHFENAQVLLYNNGLSTIWSSDSTNRYIISEADIWIVHL